MFIIGKPDLQKKNSRAGLIKKALAGRLTWKIKLQA